VGLCRVLPAVFGLAINTRYNKDVQYRQVRYKLYPTQAQLETLERWNRLHCDLYNAWVYGRSPSRKGIYPCLQQRREAWRKGANLGYYDQQNELPALKGELPEYLPLGSHALQATVRRVDRAFQAFFRRLKRGEKPGFPRFKPRPFVGFGYPDKAGWRFEPGPNGKHGVLHISNLGAIRSRGRPRQVVLTRTSMGWYATITLCCAPERKKGDGKVGIDLGVEAVATLSDGTRVENPRFLQRASSRLKRLQRQLSRRKHKGSNWKRTKAAVARLYRKAANQREDFQHKLTAGWVAKYNLIATEDLQVKKMTAYGGSRKAGLNRAILDAGMAGIYAKLAYKAKEAGTRLVEVPALKAKPSQTCPACFRQEKKTLAQRVHSCPCGCTMPRDQASAQVALLWATNPWEPGGREKPRSGFVELRNPDHTANAVGRG